ncbi:hypothetical protein AN191_08270 [Loktanella sp. 5RATIMAR09]|uniref:hypothetical protein n=1 Tax=Loktanella sp. 5RATIMAR09 TaxID=1225655 RepID=UPI0006EB4313|nr:hypothetical protein [Loktanella sp. 5RATIMAR09]KQI72130.1 hypothetical protein AN191_08270 [Loktanella sp. 5RATIMAR09]
MAEARGQVFELSSIKIPESFPERRGLPRGVEVADETQLTRYDDTTLIYDCFYSPDRKQIIAYLPKMLDFAPMLRRATFRVDDRRAKPKISTTRLFDRLIFPAATAPRHLEIHLRDITLTLPVQLEISELFAGQNCLYSIQKDQDLAWIRDWAAFHVQEQGATAVLLCDNASTRYRSMDVFNTLKTVSGLRSVAVVQVPFSWGPTRGITKRHGRTKFLQTAMMNAMRDRFLRKARAVLNCDIDELFLRKGPASCFDQAAGPIGFVAMNGEWRFAASTGQPVRHVDHWMKSQDPPPCAPKYCAAPAHGLGRLTWGIHGLERVSRRLLPVSKEFQMIHCRNISNSWKLDRTNSDETGLIADDDLRRKLQTVFTA